MQLHFVSTTCWIWQTGSYTAGWEVVGSLQQGLQRRGYSTDPCKPPVHSYKNSNISVMEMGMEGEHIQTYFIIYFSNKVFFSCFSVFRRLAISICYCTPRLTLPVQFSLSSLLLLPKHFLLILCSLYLSGCEKCQKNTALWILLFFGQSGKQQLPFQSCKGPPHYSND